MPAILRTKLVSPDQKSVAQKSENSQWNPGSDINPEVLSYHDPHRLLIKNEQVHSVYRLLAIDISKATGL